MVPRSGEDHNISYCEVLLAYGLLCKGTGIFSASTDEEYS
ncbi:hypothetical protein T10_7038 [Trichinella papuae]|uniref:Uncharacterized protein n=1 Tax=Trichinella papuae TaxID=268474 RepID=A0A0V1M2U8_9BILA|nr:hypothetical protein T10_7038 [Trichinella papuae]